MKTNRSYWIKLDYEFPFYISDEKPVIIYNVGNNSFMVETKKENLQKFYEQEIQCYLYWQYIEKPDFFDETYKECAKIDWVYKEKRYEEIKKEIKQEKNEKLHDPDFLNLNITMSKLSLDYFFNGIYDFKLAFDCMFDFFEKKYGKRSWTNPYSLNK